MEYPKELVYSTRFAYPKHLNFKEQLPRYLVSIKDHTPLRQGVATPIGMSRIAISMPGYTVSSHAGGYT
jgi:hypothetical protein